MSGPGVVVDVPLLRRRICELRDSSDNGFIEGGYEWFENVWRNSSSEMSGARVDTGHEKEDLGLRRAAIELSEGVGVVNELIDFA